MLIDNSLAKERSVQGCCERCADSKEWRNNKPQGPTFSLWS